MKILHVLNHFLPHHIAGTEMYVYALAKAMDQSDFESLVIIPNYGAQENDEYIFEHIRVIKYAEPSIVDRDLQMGKRKPDGLGAFIEIIKKERPDIVHFHEIAGSNGITFSHVAAARDLNFKIVITIHLSRYTASVDNSSYTDDIFNTNQAVKNFYKNKGFGKLKIKLLTLFGSFIAATKFNLLMFGRIGTAFSVPNLIIKKKNNFLSLFSNSDKVVTVAKWYYEVLKKNVGDKKLVFIEQGITQWQGIERKKILHSNSLNIVFVGRISQIKGVKLLINAVSDLGGRLIKLDIYGDSGEDPQYIDDCKEMGNESIRFMGRLNPSKIISVLSEYDLLVFPSTVHEMYGLVIREAFAAGIPVLASDSMGAKEQIEDGGNGWLFRMNDVEDLKEKLKWLIHHPEKITEAAKHLPNPRTFEKVAEEYDLLYRTIKNPVAASKSS